MVDLAFSPDSEAQCPSCGLWPLKSSDRICTIGVDQSILGRILGYGTIIVIGTGRTKEKSIANPLEFRHQVQEQTPA